MNKLLLLSFVSLSSLSTVAFAEETKVSNVANTELCLIGDSDGLCSEGDERSPFFKQKSILTAIKEDLNRDNGVNGNLVRVDDQNDQIFKKVAGGNGVRVRVRSRYQGAPYSFGIIPGYEASDAYVRYVSGAKFSTRGKVFLKSCAGYEPRQALGKERCAEFDQSVMADSSMTEIKLEPFILFQFAIERVTDLTDGPASIKGLNTVTNAVTDAVTSAIGNRGEIISSLAKRNSSKQDQMVTFRYDQPVKLEDGSMTTTYVLAFNDNASQANAQFNDYVVEVQLAEPTLTDFGGPSL